MAHRSNKNWLSLLVGPSQAIPRTGSVEEIPSARAAFDFSWLNSDLPEVHQLHEGVGIRERRDGALTAEIYVPAGTGPFPTVLYLHGGSWCVGSPEGARRPAMRIAEQGYVVVNLDYRLAPERPFPCALEDCLYAARWITRNIDRYQGDPLRLIISGDSAGANLSAAVIVVLAGIDHPLDEGDLEGVPVRFSGAL
ncbi:MAG: alpha/beta hydrolase, partial [Acidimicrobiia bacterium]